MTINLEPVSYRNEKLDKSLDIHSLAEAICEWSFHLNFHDENYLLSRINILRSFFGIGQEEDTESSRSVDALMSGYGKIPAFQILPLETALEIPSKLEGDTHIEISRQYKGELADLIANVRRIQRSYIQTLILHAIPGRMRGKSLTLSAAISLGLPTSEPEIEEEYWH